MQTKGTRAHSLDVRIDTDVPLAPLTSLRLGGAARHLTVVSREEEIPEALAEAERLGVPAVVLGGGSNVVIGDDGVNALVVRMALRGREISVREGVASVALAAGEPWDDAVALAVSQGWSGVECLGGIPGLVGATPIQNVGAYGQEVSDTITGVRAYDREARAFVDLTPAECRFGYRASRLKETGRFIVSRVSFAFPVQSTSAPIRYAELSRALEVAEGERAPLGRVHETVVALRRAKGMVLDEADPESVSAGSFFVNPVVDDALLARIVTAAGARPVPRHAAGGGTWKVPAAWLIEQSGFARGFTMGHVRVSRKHTLALVNEGGTTHDLLELARTVARGVRERFGVTLTPEPVMIGCEI